MSRAAFQPGADLNFDSIETAATSTAPPPPPGAIASLRLWILALAHSMSAPAARLHFAVGA